MESEPPYTAHVVWSSSTTTRLVTCALAGLDDCSITLSFDPLPDEEVTLLASKLASAGRTLIQWSTYDSIGHSATQTLPSSTISSSYVIRKALIRKHFLHQTFVNHFAKNPDSLLKAAVPCTWSFELAFADELEELWSDELWELGEALDKNEFSSDSRSTWFILKPGMADRGNGIRLFRSREQLSEIFGGFDDLDDSDGGEEEMNPSHEDSTAITSSQLRHFVIQEYLSNPLLVDPLECKVERKSISRERVLGSANGRKFHLRAYCVASGALSVYLCPNILALFAAVNYCEPGKGLPGGSENDRNTFGVNLAPHLTNTSLQTGDDTEDSVRLLSELAGCKIMSKSGLETLINENDISNITDQVAKVLAMTFQAALQTTVHFQPLPNAFELFGADLLVTDLGGSEFQVHILELNAEPAIELTGARLSWILQDLFDGIAKACIGEKLECVPKKKPIESWNVGETKHGLIKCLEVAVRGPGSW